MTNDVLRSLVFNNLLELSTEEGINASGKDEIYGCIFGRDSALTILKMLRVHKKSPSLELLEVSKKGLLTLVALQGTEFNKESGEVPGKYIHEFRKNEKQYRHLVNQPKPWYLYEDKTLRNYDSIDATPLTLIALYKYWEISGDNNFLLTILPSVEKALNWIISYGDMDKDMLIEYELPHDRKHGGLPVQSWTDSVESLLRKDGTFPLYPIAPVEAQGYAWLALKLWADFYMTYSETFAKNLLSQANKMKRVFNNTFLLKDRGLTFPGQALDGKKELITTVTGNPLLLLWATYDNGPIKESILDEQYIPDLVARIMMEDMFDQAAGIRTMSTISDTYNPGQDSYHNGSFWPILNGLAHEGLEAWGYKKEAHMLREASLKPIIHFQTPIELYIKTQTGDYLEYRNERGQTSCKVQAWSAAATLDFLTVTDLSVNDSRDPHTDQP